MLTKEDIAQEIETEYSSATAEHIRALDVCTPAERELVEAFADPSETSEAFKRRQDALLALEAERTPPDPVETFIAEVRKTRDDWANFTSVRCALDPLLAKLDAARGRKP